MTANGGAAGDVLAGGKINDPALNALADQAKKFNLKGLNHLI